MASIFSRIIRRELPAYLVDEDAHTASFLDIHPKAEGHTLVVPKLEVANYHDLPTEVLGHLAVAVARVAGGVTRAMGTPHYNLSVNNGALAGQIIFHVHIHVIPRRDNVSYSDLHLSPERLEEIASNIRQAIASPNPPREGP